MTKTYFVLGAKWFDKINGNTYCNARVYDSDGETLFYIGYQYGYGSQYFYEARKALEERFGSDIKVIDLGAFPMKKTAVRNNLF